MKDRKSQKETVKERWTGLDGKRLEGWMPEAWGGGEYGLKEGASEENPNDVDDDEVKAPKDMHFEQEGMLQA